MAPSRTLARWQEAPVAQRIEHLYGQQGRIDELFVSAGQSAGLVDGVESASEIVRLVAEADDAYWHAGEAV